jgi:glycosyltransferase involved in cell wall biosynthesis
MHLLDAGDLSGPAKTVLNSCRFTDNERYSKSVVVFGQGGRNRYAEDLVGRGMRVFVIEDGNSSRFGKIHTYIKNICEIRRLILKYQVDLVHAHGYKADVLGYPASKMTGRKIVTTQHGYIENSAKAIFYRRLAIAAAKRMDRVIAVSDGMKSRLMEYGVPAEKIVTIRNAIVSEDYAERERDLDLLERLHLAGRTPIIGCIGRISPEKGQRVLCDAFMEIRKRYPKACLVFVGKGPELEELKSRYGGDGEGIVFAGHQADVKPFVSVFDLHVLPSYTEGLPNVVLETGCMGVVTVGTAVGGTPECIIDGVTGLLVRPGRVDELARAITLVLGDENLKGELERNVMDFVMKEFDFRKRVEKMLGLYDELLTDIKEKG